MEWSIISVRCMICGTEVETADWSRRKYCDRCAPKAKNARRNALRAERLRLGLCRDCGKAPCMEGRHRCESCFLKNRERDALWKKNNCGYKRDDVVQDVIKSEKILANREARTRRAMKKRTEKRILEHRCIRCGRALHDDYYFRTCPDCMKYSRERYAALKRDGLCICCAKPATPGLTMCEACAARARMLRKKRAWGCEP